MAWETGTWSQVGWLLTPGAESEPWVTTCALGAEKRGLG